MAVRQLPRSGRRTDEALRWLANAIDLGFINHGSCRRATRSWLRSGATRASRRSWTKAREKQRAFEV